MSVEVAAGLSEPDELLDDPGGVEWRGGRPLQWGAPPRAGGVTATIISLAVFARLVISHRRGAVSTSVASIERSWNRPVVGSSSIWAGKG
ncbi:hypothetical protein ACWGDT_01795 [Streptomyces avermitilis]